MRLLLLHLLVIGACEAPGGFPFPTDAKRFSPPAIYREWWSRTEQCSGRHGSFDSVSWYVVAGAHTVPGTNERNAAWYPAGNRIVLSGAEDGLAGGDLVRHEMLHAILRTGGHPRDIFVGRCGGVVVCIEQCLVDGREPSPPDESARPEPPNTLEVTVSVVPNAPSSATWDGYFMMVVSAWNPTDHSAVIELPGSHGDDGPPVSFSCDIRNAQHGGMSYDMRANAPEVARFAPGETKQFIFDFHNVSGPYRYDVAPGTYTFKGAFAGVWASSSPTVVVGP